MIVSVYLDDETYKPWARRAEAEGTTVGILLAVAAKRAVRAPKRRRRVRVPGEPPRKYVRVTEEMRQRIAAMHAEGVAPAEIAATVGISVGSVYNHLPRETS